MAEPPFHLSQYPPAPSSEPPRCICHNNPIITRQQCPCCINRPSTMVHWGPPVYHSPYSPTSAYNCNNEYRPQPTMSQNSKPSKGGIRPYYWVDTFSRGSVPSTALHGGHDVDGSQIFVGRAFHEGDWIPAKVIPERNIAYVAYGGAEHAKHQYQVLCEQRFDWVSSSGGHVPPGAVEGGKTADGESLYIGRVHHDGACTVGKVHPSHGVCYIPFDGREVGHGGYEILVLRH